MILNNSGFNVKKKIAPKNKYACSFGTLRQVFPNLISRFSTVTNWAVMQLFIMHE
jgi:hypothetical protein